jgi:hypothetical protein
MDHIEAIQEIIDTHKDKIPVYVATRVMEECQKLYESLRDQNSDEEDVDDYPEVVQIDPPAGMNCHDFNNRELVEGDIVRVLATGALLTVERIVYEGFEDRRLADQFSEPGFQLSPSDGTGLVNAGDCEKVDVETE